MNDLTPPSHAASVGAPWRLGHQFWFLVLLACYAILELSFNHQLLALAGGLQPPTSALVFHDMEVWARVVSGLGLALLLMRCLDRYFLSRVRLVLVCTCVGLLVMGYAQKAIVDAIVARATPADLAMSVHARMSTSQAVVGRMALRGEVVLTEPASAELQPIMRALWTSSVLGLSPDEVEVTSGAAQWVANFLPPQFSAEQKQAAYRVAVMTPVALGASLFFGLLNLCQLFAGLGVRLMAGLGWQGLLRRVEPFLLTFCVSVCLVLSLWPGNAWVNSAGYSQVARPALWQQKPFLAPFVDWSLRAEPAWSEPVSWVHRYLLLDFEFSNPLRD